MEKVKSFIKQHWMPIAFLALIILIICLEIRRRKKAQVNEITETPFFRDSFLFYPMEYMLSPDNRVEDLKDLSDNYTGDASNSKTAGKTNGKPGKYIIGPEVEAAAAKNPAVADTLSKFKSIFDGQEICSLPKLIQKGNEKKILIMGSNVTHTMEFNPRRVIVDEMMDKCVGPGCHTWFAVKSIGS